jgi:hypothetical protein
MASSELNPFLLRVETQQRKRHSLHAERKSQQQALDAALRFDRKAALQQIEDNASRASGLLDEAETLKQRLREVELQIEAVQDQLNAAPAMGSMAPAIIGGVLVGGLAAAAMVRGGWGGIGLRMATAALGAGVSSGSGFQWFRSSKDNAGLQAALEQKQRTRQVLNAEFTRTVDAAQRINSENQERISQLQGTSHLDEDQARSRIAALDVRIAALDEEITALGLLRDRLDQKLGSLPGDIENDTFILRQLKLRHGLLKDLDAELQTVDANSRDAKARRYQIHQKCYDILEISADPADYGSEKAYREAGNPRMQAQRLKREMDAVERRLRKRLQRVQELVEQVELKIEAVILDGNNLCYEHTGQSRSFVGVGAAKAVARWFSEHRKEVRVEVVFDPGILTRLGKLRASATSAEPSRLRESELAREFAGWARVTIAKDSADRTVLTAADADTTFVISNDNFDEYREMAAVREKRVLKFDLVNKTVTISRLDLAAHYQN